ncbi:MAG: primosomal protein N', partial [Xanthomonadales bacterium]|nr:primosomal protein N' [Xanthomonadales bacterium]
MSTAPIWKVALPVPVPRLFDYLPPEDDPPVSPGVRVLVPFGRRRLIGILAGTAQTSEVPRERLVRAIATPDGEEATLDATTLELLAWCSGYYKHAIGEVMLSALPPVLRKPGSVLPAPPVAWRITGVGRERLQHGNRSARVQNTILDMLTVGDCDATALCAAGNSWRAALSRLLEQGYVIEVEPPPKVANVVPGPSPTGEQREALNDVGSVLEGFRCHLLDGVTGSGKTEVYMRLIEDVLSAGRQALVLVPEIGLTPQLLQRFRRRLGLEPAVIHSRLSAGQRLAAWDGMRSGREPLLIGTRSALFTPMPRPGLIILDEEHDASFRQQDGFRYSARDVAVKRAAMLDVPVVLGSATPSLESLKNAVEGRYGWSRLRQRATRASLPLWRVLDLRQEPLDHGISETALREAAEVVARGEQVMVFLNRRGYAPVLMCGQCGWPAECSRCDANMTWHREARLLCCHHCGAQARVPRLCPGCSADALEGIGQGTQQLEEMLEGRFEGVPVLRFDLDQVSRKGVLDAQIEQVREGKPCILVGTQMLAKGHHFPEVTLVIVVGVDQALYSADYRALERMGQLLEQVAGRAGRAEKQGTVMLQTLHPDHEALERLMSQGYEAYARWLLDDRCAAGLPPYGHMALLRAEAHGKHEVVEFLESARRLFPQGEARVMG